MREKEEETFVLLPPSRIFERSRKNKRSKKLNCKICGQKNCPNKTYKEKLLCAKNNRIESSYEGNRFFEKYISKKNQKEKSK